MKPYKKDWAEWSEDKSCFLEKEEVLVVNWALGTKAYRKLFKETEFSDVMTYITLKNSITKLNLFLEIFKKYQKIQRVRKKSSLTHKKTGRVSRF